MNEAIATDPYQAPVSNVAVAPSDDLFAAYVGPDNTGYYLQRFERFLRGGSKLSWHWPAFFVTGLWLLYRKMWSLALFYYVGLPLLLVIASVLLAVAGAPESAAVGLTALYYLFIFLVVPIFANLLYFRQVQGKVEKVSSAFPDTESRAAELARIGGTSRAWVFVVFIVGLAGLLAAIAVPAYQDYTIREQVAEGLSLAAGPKAAVTEAWEDTGRFPADNAAAGLAEADAMSGSFVESIHVREGTINVFYGTGAHELLQGRVLVLEPVAVDGSLEWSCGSDNIDPRHLPAACRE